MHVNNDHMPAADNEVAVWILFAATLMLSGIVSVVTLGKYHANKRRH